jgi:hypothetical protein
MDILKIYYYTGIPLVTCNMLFYSISALSTSITSSQNVVKFISENKDCDSILFQNEIETNDITNKLKIVESLVFDILKKYSNNKKEFEEFKSNLITPAIFNEDQDETKEFTIIELKLYNKNILERIDEPIRYALLSTTEITQQLNNTLINCNNKINNYKQSYVKNIISLNLQKELNDFKKQINILDKRFNLLLELLKIYVKH